MKTVNPIVLSLLLLAPAYAYAQDKYGTRDAEISFHSSTPLEDINAINTKVASVFIPATGEVQFSALVKAFEFEKALMQEHFNENYMESSTFPKATFRGKLVPADGSDLSKPGSYPVDVEGALTIHGVEKPVKARGNLDVADDGTISASSSFDIKPEDHGITIPGVVREKIARTIRTEVRLTWKKL